jgi:hypothetical protein
MDGFPVKRVAVRACELVAYDIWIVVMPFAVLVVKRISQHACRSSDVGMYGAGFTLRYALRAFHLTWRLAIS